MTRSTWRCGIALLATIGQLCIAAPQALPDAATLAVDASPLAVTMYQGRASVTRSTTLDLNPGLYDLTFGNLPESIQPLSIQARADGPVKVLSVDFSQQPVTESSSPELAKLDQQIASVQKQISDIADERGLLESQEAFIDAVSIRATTDASQAGGTAKLDLDAVRKQLTFVSEERERLMKARRELDDRQRDREEDLAVLQGRRGAVAGAGGIARTAVVSVAVTESSQVRVDLTYLVANATWEPSYNIRAGLAGSAAQIEYDALLTQRTGEDWDNVRLTLSTAQPTIAANPPILAPWFIDVFHPEDDRTVSAPSMQAPGRMAAPWQADEVRLKHANAEALAEELARLSADAAVGGGGPSVTFQLPRTVTVKTDSQKQQRTRIAAMETRPRFVHVAQPMLTESVYLRGDLTNSSAYQFLPGRASIFIGQDFVGPTVLGSVAPGGEFKVYFGIDNSVKAKRQLVSKKTENTGLLGGGRRTIYNYRITVDNGSGAAITLELRDRIPVSRSDQIQVELADVSVPLADDTYYLTEERPQGILKWWLTIPTTARDASPFEILYTVRVNRAKDVEMTPLPE